MSQIDGKVAAIFLVLVAIVANQFSFLLAIAILVQAFFIHQGYQMSDLKVYVHNRTQTLISTLYSWTESTVTTITRKCKKLATSRNRSPAQNFSDSCKRDIRQDYCPETENVLHNRENIYQGTNLIQGRRISHKDPEKTSYSPVNLSEWHRTPPSPNTLNLYKKHNGMNQHGSEMDSFTRRVSPWGYTLSPQQRNTVTDVRPIQAVACPLLASAKYNMNRDSAIFIDVKSPGFSTRLLKYHTDAAIHQPQYARPGQLPLLHLNHSPLPSLNSRNSRKVRAPVRVRIASPSYDVSESRLFSRPDNQAEPERQSKSVVDVLKEISRKRIRTEEAGNDPKRHHRSDSSSSSSSSSSPAMVNGIIIEETSTGKRPREEESPKLQMKTFKRTRNNEIYSSLSSSRNICVGTKRKAADNWSRCSTPAPLGKHLKKSPHVSTSPSTEVEDSKRSEPQVKNDEGMVIGTSLSPPSQEISVEAQPSSPEECRKEEMSSNKIQPPKNFHGRLFPKSLAKGIENEHENIRRRDGGTKPWKTRRAVDDIAGEDIIRQDMDLCSRRLNSMLSVIQSSASISVDSSKPDAVDGPPSKLGPSVSFTNKPEAKSDTHIVNEKDKTIEGAPNKQAIKSFSPQASNIKENLSTQVKQNVTTSEASAVIPTFSVVQTPIENASPQIAAKEKQVIVEPSPPVKSIPSLVSPVTSTTFSISHPAPFIVPATSAAVSTTPATVSLPLHSNTSSTAPSGTFGSAPTATFTLPQQPEKSHVVTTPSFSFGATSVSSAVLPLAPKSGFTMPTSVAMTSPPICSASQTTSVFTIPASTPAVISSSSVDAAKTEAAAATVSGRFMFGATSAAVTPSTSEFSVLKTTPSVVAFGVSAPLTSTVASLPSVVTSLPSATITTCVGSNPLATKQTFSFGTSVTSSAPPATVTSTAAGFNFQFGAGSQPTPVAPKPQDAGGFKFSFGANKESMPLNQSTVAPTPKPPVFGESFAFGASQGNNSQESKPMTFGTPTSLTPTLAAPTSNPSGGGFNFSANSSAGGALSKPTFGFGTANPSTGTNPPLVAPLAGGFNFGPKPAEAAPAPPPSSLGTPFQFGSSTHAMPTPSTLQTQQQQQQQQLQQQQQQQPAQPIGNPFSIGGATEQKQPPMLGGGFSFGSNPSANVPTLQSNVSDFGLPSVPTFGSPSVNPLQSPPQSNPSLFQFGSGGGAMTQPGMSSGGFNFGGAPATGVPSAGFNFNPPGPSATTPFQFGAAPLQAPAMFSIGSGSTAPRSRPRNRRQK